QRGYLKLPVQYDQGLLIPQLIKTADVETMLVTSRIARGYAFLNGLASVDVTDVGQVFDQKREHGRKVTVITYESLQRDIGRGIVDPAKFRLLLLDRAQRAMYGENPELLSQ